MMALIALASLGVDLARVRLTKLELQAIADVAARAGAASIPNGAAAAKNQAITVAGKNTSAGAPVTLVASDIVVDTAANTCQVSIQRTLPLLFAKAVGQNTCDVHVTATAKLTGLAPVQVPGFANPWLASMPDGTYGGAAVSGTAPTNSPIAVSGIAINPGSTITFQVSGSAADDPININKAWTPDGQADGGGMRTNDSGYLNGMSNLNTQQGALVGVFLSDSPPDLSPAPANLDMSGNGTSGMNYDSFSPQLKQPFFIGDGKNNNNGNQQTIIVPAGATRLFLGMHDNINWENNSGYLIVSFNGSGVPHVVLIN